MCFAKFLIYFLNRQGAASSLCKIVNLFFKQAGRGPQPFAPWPALAKHPKMLAKTVKTLFALLAVSLAPALGLRAQEGAPAEGQGGGGVFVNSLQMSFAPVPPGIFMMGAGRYDTDFDITETPQHQVTISEGFWVGVHEVTQGHWEALMGSNPSRFRLPVNPVEQVSYDDALAFIAKLNAKEGADAYRLPTEAEWEYFARAGTISPYFFGDAPDSLSIYAWYRDNSGGRTHPAGALKPNPWGLYDIYGNVAEMLSDWFGPDWYSKSSRKDPGGPDSGDGKSLRGGGFSSTSYGSRSSFRDLVRPSYRESVIGFRLVMTRPPENMSTQK